LLFQLVQTELHLPPPMGVSGHLPYSLPVSPKQFLALNTSTLKTGTVCAYETLVSINKTAWCHSPEHYTQPWKPQISSCWIWGSHIANYEEYSRPGLTSCSSERVFRQTYCLQLQRWRVSKLSLLPISAIFLLGLLFDPKDGGAMFLRNIVQSLNYIVL
jgi:hypothetical protein